MADASLSETPTHAQLLSQLDALMERSEPLLTQMANMAALLYWSFPDVNWVGFYLLRGEQLFLGPFQGKPACTVLDIGRGVCGRAVTSRHTQDVPDVHAFPGHIACDAASNAEVVVPLIGDADALWGVLDVDSPTRNRFSQADVRFFESAAALLQQRRAAAHGMIFPLDNTA